MWRRPPQAMKVNFGYCSTTLAGSTVLSTSFFLLTLSNFPNLIKGKHPIAEQCRIDLNCQTKGNYCLLTIMQRTVKRIGYRI